MKPQTLGNDVDYLPSDNEPAVNKPVPALSSPTTTGVSQPAASNLPPSPVSPLPAYESHDQINQQPLPGKEGTPRKRSNSPAISAANREANLNLEQRDIIIRSFAPHIVVYASTDAEELVANKGLTGGLANLLRPFGDQIHGKVVTRDSHGISRAWEDFGVRIRNPTTAAQPVNVTPKPEAEKASKQPKTASNIASADSGIDWTAILGASSDNLSKKGVLVDGAFSRPLPCESGGSASALYTTYLQKLLSSSTVVPHETFCHPVACLVAVSSRNSAPIETLRELYTMTTGTHPTIPEWMGTDYLRYYVLIHDEDRDDISKSVSLFDLMKRHFGLHCHLLRLRSSHCVSTDDDSFQVPSIQWIAAEEIQTLLKSEEVLGGSEKSIFESDANAIIAFVREMVTQSIIPFMENRTTAWNDQVASRKRGIGGRFISMSRRWAGFSSAKPNNAANGASGPLSNSNFNAELGYYAPHTPEAVMRLLADHAMMLRDWRLAYSTYNLVRSDYNHDKAWAYHAAANEMTVLSSLLVAPQHIKLRLENVDQWLDAALYSYLTRCSVPGGAKRCLLLSTELSHARVGIPIDRAAAWAARLLETSVLDCLEQCLVIERIATLYSTRAAGLARNPFNRHAALWSLIASLSWLKLGRPTPAQGQIMQAQNLYTELSDDHCMLPFASMGPLWKEVAGEIRYLNGSQGSQAFVDTSISGSIDPQIDNFVAASKLVPHRTGHFSRKSEVSETVPFPKNYEENDGFE